MKQTLAKLWQSLKAFAKRHRGTVIGAAVVLALIPMVLWLIALDRRYSWTGWGAIDNPGYAEQPRFLWGKSVWDWLDLLLVPIVLAVAGLLFNQAERQAERKIADQRIKEDRRIAAQRAETEREIAADRTRGATLQNYFDKMTELLCVHELRKSEPGDEERSIARARTLTALRGLDKVRKGVLLQFLCESGLIGPEAVVNLCKAELFEADLVEADLFEADLRETFLIKADLSGAILSRANLSEAYLIRAILQGADLQGAILSEADLSGAILSEADLSGAILSGADLSEAILSEADLSQVNLSRADLHWADLSGANLRGAKVTEEQLAQARSLKGAMMPDGTVHE